MADNNIQALPSDGQRPDDSRVAGLVIPAVIITFILTVIGGLIVNGLTEGAKRSLENGDFYKSMSSGAQGEFKEKATEINKCLGDIRTAQSRGDKQLEAKHRRDLSKLYNDSALIVENDLPNMIRNDPKMSEHAKNYVSAMRNTAKSVRKMGTPLPGPQANQASPEGSGQKNAVRTASLTERLSSGSSIRNARSTRVDEAKLQLASGTPVGSLRSVDESTDAMTADGGAEVLVPNGKTEAKANENKNRQIQRG
jgi:hypothetical protein